MQLVEEAYALAACVARAGDPDLARQIRRAAVSVPSNIAEGYGRYARVEYRRYLAISNGSVRELETQALLAVRLALARSAAAEPALRRCEQVGQVLTALRRSLAP